MRVEVILFFASILVGSVTGLPCARADDAGVAVSNAWGKISEEGRNVLVIGKIKAAYADRKDIPGRLIRVRYDGKTLQLAGFVPSKEVGDAAERIARKVARPEAVTPCGCFRACVAESRI